MRLAGLLTLLIAALLAGCSSAPPAPVTVSVPSPVESIPDYELKRHDVVFQAFSLVGTPYRWGGSSPATGFDCSGLIQYVYREAAGVSLPRTTSDLYNMKVSRPPENSLAPGDLVLFAMNGGRVKPCRHLHRRWAFSACAQHRWCGAGGRAGILLLAAQLQGCAPGTGQSLSPYGEPSARPRALSILCRQQCLRR